MGVFDM